MRISKIYIERFGCYRNYAVEDLSHPVTVFFGPNEAGKSTLHAFIRFILYGYDQRGEHPYRPIGGGELGGFLEGEWEGRLVRLTRHTPPKRGRLLVEVDGRREEEVFLSRLLGHLPFHLFQAIFSFSHQELSQIHVFGQEELHDYLYAAAMGGGAVNLLHLEEKLAGKREELFKPRGVKPRINQLLTSLKNKEKEIASLKEKAEHYSSLRQEKKTVEEELIGLRQDRLKLERELSQLELLRQGLEIKKERERLTEELAQLAPFSYLPWRQEIHQLKEKEPLIRAKEKELVKLAEQRHQAEREIEEALLALGSPWREDPHLAGKLTVTMKDRLWQAGEALKKAEEQFERKKMELKELKGKEKIAGERWQKGKEEWERMHAASPPDLGRGRGYLPWLLAGGLLLFLLLPALGEAVSPWWWLANGLLAVLLAGGWLYVRRLEEKNRERLAKWEEEWQKARLFQDRYIHNLQEEWEEAQRLVREGERELEQLAARLSRAQGEWQAALAELGWPGVSPASLSELFSRINDLNQGLAKEKELAREQERRATEIGEWQKEVARLALQLGGQEAPSDPLPSVEEACLLLARWAEELKKEEKRAQIKEQLQDKLEELDKRERELVQSLGWMPAQWLQELARGDEGELAEKEELLRHKLETLQDEVEKRASQKGRLESQIEELKTDERLAEEVQAFAEEKEELNRLARRYAVLVLAGHLLGQTRKIYEEKRQPAVLREAGAYFAQMTGGRYTGLVAPLGERTLYVKDRGERRWPLHHLSQGTKEQLYLALRLAFIKVFDQRVRLPLFLDDPLVNCDEERLYGILRGLATISDSHQVILFTCHLHILQAAEDVFREKLKVIPLAQAPILS